MSGQHHMFECKVSYERHAEEALKRVTETYLVDAVAYVDAEQRLIEELTPFVMSGELMISNIKRIKISEIFDSEIETEDRYFRARVLFITLDEKNGVEKRSASIMLIKSDTLPKAMEKLQKELEKTLLSNYEIASITDTNIMDIFYYEC